MNYLKLYLIILIALLSYDAINAFFNLCYLLIKSFIDRKRRLKSGEYIHEDNNS